MIGFDKIVAQIVSKRRKENRSRNDEWYLAYDLPPEYLEANPYDRRKMYIETVNGKVSVIAMEKYPHSGRYLFATDSTIIQFFDGIATDYTSVSDQERLLRVHGCATFIMNALMEGRNKKYGIDRTELYDAFLRLKNKCDNVKGYEFSNVVKGKNSKNYLAMAIASGDDDLARFLVESLGVDVNRYGKYADESWDRALDLACELRNMDMIKYLISKGAQPTEECGRHAAKTLDIEMMSELIKGGLDVNHPSLLDVVLDIANRQKKNVQSIGKNVGEMIDVLVEAGAKTEKEVAAEKQPVRRRVATLKKNVLVKMTHNYIKKSEERERRIQEERIK